MIFRHCFYHMSWQKVILSLLLLAFCRCRSSQAQVSASTDELLSLLPAETIACLVLEDLADTQKRLGSDSWGQEFQLVRRWLRSKIVLKGWGEPEAQFFKQAGLSPDEYWDAIFGQTTALVLIAPTAGSDPDNNNAVQTDQPAGLLLARVQAQALLENLMALDFLQSYPTRTYRGFEYRLRQKGKQTEYLLQLGPILAFTDREALIHRLIEQYTLPVPKRTPFLSAAIWQQVPDASLLQLWINPRAADSLVAQKLRELQDLENSPQAVAAAQLISQSWRKLDWSVGSVQIEPRRLTLRWQIQFHEPKPQAASNVAPVATNASVSSPYWQQIPSSAIWVSMATVDWQQLGKQLLPLLEERDRAELQQGMRVLGQLFAGYDFVDEVLTRLGPTTALVVLAGDRFPQVLLTLELQATPTPEQAALPFATNLQALLHTFWVILASEQSKKSPQPWNVYFQKLDLAPGHKNENEMDPHVPGIHWAQNDNPAWEPLQPSFCVTPQTLLIASHPAAIRAWFATTPKQSLGYQLAQNQPERLAAFRFYWQLEQTLQLAVRSRAALQALPTNEKKPATPLTLEQVLVGFAFWGRYAERIDPITIQMVELPDQLTWVLCLGDPVPATQMTPATPSANSSR